MIVEQQGKYSFAFKMNIFPEGPDLTSLDIFLSSPTNALAVFSIPRAICTGLAPAATIWEK
jgi:hypothetical protein